MKRVITAPDLDAGTLRGILETQVNPNSEESSVPYAVPYRAKVFLNKNDMSITFQWEAEAEDNKEE